MSIYGIGIDICEITRVEKSLTRDAEAFSSKILHPDEKNIFDKHNFQARFLAKRFAAKEAFAKALGTGIADGVILPDIQVKNNELGKPYLKLHGEALSKMAHISGAQLHLSISDEKHYAVAQVIIEQ